MARFVRLPVVRARHAHFTHREFLRRLAPGQNGLSVAYSPKSMGIAVRSPFDDAEVLAVAARIAPRSWMHGPVNRHFARSMLRGLVSDEIRLWRGRGAQGADVWFIHHTGRDRYMSEVAELANTPVLCDVVDHASVRDEALRWAWGDPTAAPDTFITITRILMLATFVRSSATVHANRVSRE